MTDKELLELAAKAAGLINQGYCEAGFLFIGTGESGAFYKWNPLTDDGDALRLAVKLKIPIHWEKFPSGIRYVTCHGVWNSNTSEWDDVATKLDDDPYAATRQAIVRAAAEIGRGMVSVQDGYISK